MKGQLRCYIFALLLIFICFGCGASVADYVSQSTATLQPIIDQTRALCRLSRSLAQVTKDTDKEAEIVAVCTQIWDGWSAVRAIQDALALDEDEADK